MDRKAATYAAAALSLALTAAATVGSHLDRGLSSSSSTTLAQNTYTSEALQRHIEMSTEYFIVPKRPTVTTTPLGTRTTIATPKCVECTTSTSGLLRNEMWVVPLLVCAGITMLLIVCFEIFVLCKARQTIPSRRHLFLGQMLLLGLFFAATVAAIIAISPTQLTCAVVRFGTGVAYAVIFSSLLVKCIFLISLNGGVYLPASYQGLLLFFAILIQIAVGIQWLFTNPPIVDAISFENVIVHRHQLLVTVEDVTSSVIVPLCRTTYISTLLSLVYVIFLILFVTVLAFKSRGIRDNYREATYIGLSIGCTIPTWLVWIASGFVVGERHRDACVGFGLVVTSIVTFLVMFMPKSRQLAAMGKDGLYLEDREERFSSLSRAGSGYSPSFYHFKPTKYGIISHKHPAASLSRDRIILYPAPPSYSRTCHYLPGPPGYYPSRYFSGGVLVRPDDGNLYTTLEQTLSSNPNVYFQRGNGVHPGMMY